MKLLITFLLLAVAAFAQQPQTSTAPISALNAKYNQGVGNGYWAQKPASGLVVTVTPGTCIITASGTVVNYAGGTITAIDTNTNYIYLDGTCNLTQNTTGFLASTKPIAIAVASGGNVTTLTDVRTMQDVTAATAYTGTAPIVVGGTVISCPTCATGAPNNATATMAGAYFNLAVTTSASNPMFNAGATSLGTCGNRVRWPMSGYFVTPAGVLVTNQGGGQVWRLATNVSCAGIENATSAPQPGGLVIPTVNAGGYASTSQLDYWRVLQMQETAIGISRQGTATTAAAGEFGEATVGFIADSGVWTILGNYQPVAAGSPGIGVTDYTGPGWNAGFTTTEATYSLPLPVAGTIGNFACSTAGAEPSTGSSVFTVRKTPLGGSPASTVVTFTIGSLGGVGAYYDITHTFSVVAGDAIDWQYAQVTTAGPGYAGCTLGFLPATGNTAIIWGSNNGQSISATNFFGPFQRLSSTASALTVAAAMIRPGTLSKLYIFQGSAIVSPATLAYTIQKNGADQSMTCTLNQASGSGAILCDGTHTVTYAAGDYLSLKVVSSAGVGTPFSTWSAAYD